ncbi:MAG TPA: hypothetical protein VEL79_02375, partial [Vicinamibacterales bacterium]|nr:hypothetical protein [Vicinamibacterales bacterium]
MLSLGLDLSAEGARAVVVDERGTLLAAGRGADARDAIVSATQAEAPEVGGIASPVEMADVAIAGI